MHPAGKYLSTVVFVVLLANLLSPAQMAQRATTAPPGQKDAQAEKLFRQALRAVDADRIFEAYDLAQRAAGLQPEDTSYAIAAAELKQQVVLQHLRNGNRYLQDHRHMEAAAEFHAALKLDPANNFVQQRLRDAQWGSSSGLAVEPVQYASEIQLEPAAEKKSFHFRGDGRTLIATIAQNFGIVAEFDNSFRGQSVRFDLQDADFFTAMKAASLVTNSFYFPTSSKQILVIRDSQEMRRSLERTFLRTFYVPFASGAQQLQELTALLRSMLDIRFISVHTGASVLTIRAPIEQLNAASELISSLSQSEPQVLLDVTVLQISQTAAREIGVGLPLQFTVFNINTEARKLLNTPGLDTLLNQLLQNGSLQNPNTAALAALLAAQQSQQNSPLFQGFATFGGGILKSGLVIPSAGVNFSDSENSLRSVEHMTLTAQQGNAATFRIGERFPVLTQSFAPLALRSKLIDRAVNVTNPVVPGFTYEDLGITLKTTPHINAHSQVALDFELQIKALGNQIFNGVPTISDREYKGVVVLENGQTSVIAGSLDSSEQRALTGLPGLSQIPGLRSAFSVTSNQQQTNELLIVVTPHVVRLPPPASTETYLN